MEFHVKPYESAIKGTPILKRRKPGVGLRRVQKGPQGYKRETD